MDWGTIWRRWLHIIGSVAYWTSPRTLLIMALAFSAARLLFAVGLPVLTGGLLGITFGLLGGFLVFPYGACESDFEE